MSESGFHRPRRAFAHDTDSDEPTAVDDTPGDSAGMARRGRDPHSPEQDVTAGESSDAGAPGPDADAPPEQGNAGQGNPFARPGSGSAAVPPAPVVEPLVPAPVLPGPDFDDAETTATGRRMSGLAEGPTPAPRRSAVSSATPPEHEPPTVSSASHGSGGSDSWVRHHRRTLLIWGIGALVAALLLASGFYLAGRQNSADPSPSPSISPSPSTSVSPVPDVTGEDLLSVADADKIVGGASWAVISTALTRSEATERPACLSMDTSDVNPIDTFQRSLGTSQDDGLAALHQIDVYANDGAARQVQLERAAGLAACDEVSALIKSSTTVTGLGDEVMQLTVARQDDPDPAQPGSLHTVLLVRTGRALTMLDVTRSEAVPVDGAVAGLTRSLTSICDRVDGMCPADPTATAAIPPPVDPQGWLITADLPRLRAGYGSWTPAGDPSDITSKGMGCENLPLATEPGPTSRQQRTYLLTQDDQTPKTFGLDEINFDFEDNPQARAFTTKLINNLLSCKDRVLTAKVTDLNAVNATGPDGVGLSARMITIDQAISDDSAVRFQLVVAIADTRVSYLLATVTDSYEFDEGQLKALALRTAERLSQG